jgi:hypothetical protein
MTATPTITPAVTVTPGLVSSPVPVGYKFTFGYSYYYPDLLGVNCHDNNVLSDGTCANTTASGQGWRDYVGKGVAIPVTYSTVFSSELGARWCEYYKLPCIPFGSVIRVHYPSVLAGDWYVVDTCGACDDRHNSGIVYIDFLDIQQRAAWGSPVEVEIIEVRR